MAVTLSNCPINLLGAVNVLLREVGLAEATTLLDAGTDVGNALSALSKSNVEVQSDGWWSNTEDFTMTPDESGIIAIPPNWVQVRPTRGTQSYAQRLSNRGGQLYDLKAHSFVFTTAVYLTGIQVLDWEQLPQKLRWYILCRAGKYFAIGTYPTQGTFSFTDKAEVDAKAAALQEDDELRDESAVSTSPHFAKMRRR